MGLIRMLTRADPDPEPAPDGEGEEALDASLRAALSQVRMDRDAALGVPAMAAAAEFTAGIVSALPVRLFRREGEGVVELSDDVRCALLNGDSGDELTGPEIMKAFTLDYLLGKGGYAYVNRRGNEVASIHYVDCRAVGIERVSGSHIMKESRILVDGASYYPWQFIHASRSTRDGVTGLSLVEQSCELLRTASATMAHEQAAVRRGGNRRGFLQSDQKLTQEAIKSLKTAFARMFQRDGENFVVLNRGVSFQEASETSVEMQLAENKQANSDDIMSLLLIPPGLIRGGADEDDRDNHTRYSIMPMLRVFEAALDRALLLESEKGSHFFRFDLKEYSKANMRTRWAAWANAKKNGLVDIDEFRREENMRPLGVDYINLGLNDVLMDVAERKIIVPNMGAVIDLDNLGAFQAPGRPRAPGGGDEDGGEDR